jgi:hypothetical protein
MSKYSNLVLIIILVCLAAIKAREYELEFELGDNIEVLNQYVHYFDNKIKTPLDEDYPDELESNLPDEYGSDEYEEGDYDDTALAEDDLNDYDEDITNDYWDELNVFEEDEGYLGFDDDAFYEYSDESESVLDIKLMVNETEIVMGDSDMDSKFKLFSEKLCKNIFCYSLGVFTVVTKETTIILKQSQSL